MPVWWTIIAVLLGVGGTYWLTPKLNAKFETAKIKAQYVSDNLKTLNADTAELIVTVRTFNHLVSDAADAKQVDEARLVVGNRITRLKWKALELSMIAESAEDKGLILKYSESLDDLARVMRTAAAISDLPRIDDAAKMLLDRTYLVLKFLAVKADLRISILD